MVAFALFGNLYVQAQYDENETSKLRAFLSQESAEPGVKNYQQLGLSQINDINWGSVPGLTWNGQTYLLTNIHWANKKLAGNLDLSDFKGLRIVYCQGNSLRRLNVTGDSAIIYLDCYENNLYSLDFSTNVNLTELCFRYNHLQEIDLSNNKKLSFLCSTGNQLETLDLSGLSMLSTCYCVGNKLTSLNLEGCVKLKELLCMDNFLTTLDLSDKPVLTEFSCARNNITDIIINSSTLRRFDCSNNYLKTLDLTGFYNLSYLKCSDNLLEKLIINDCTYLEELNCNNNLLDLLVAPYSYNLVSFECKENNMDFFTLPKLPESVNYIYSPQNNRVAEADISYADFSSFFEIDGFTSRYLWHESVKYLTPEMIEGGVFRFDESFSDKQLICRIENMSFPRLVLRYDVTMRNEDVGNVNPDNNVPSVYASKGYIHIVTGSVVDVRIYSMQGTLLMTKNAVEGRTDIPVERGMYVVSMNNKGYKLTVR